MKLHVDGTDTLNMRRWEEKLVPGVAAMGRCCWSHLAVFCTFGLGSDTLVSELNKLFDSHCELRVVQNKNCYCLTYVLHMLLS